MQIEPMKSGCLMSCQADEVSPIVGIMLDGFPLYGPMQYFSPSNEKIYLNPEDNCGDCVLKQLEESDLDTCGGIEIADGNADDGTTYRYIAGGRICYNLYDSYNMTSPMTFPN